MYKFNWRIKGDQEQLRPARILYLMSGSIACFKSCQVISQLVQAGCDVQVAVTPNTFQFIGKATLEGLTNKKVLSDLFEENQMMDHIHLQRWADVILLAPATANIINKMSSGVCDDLVSTLFMAHDFKKSFLIAPAMNQAMYAHPVTQSNLLKLQQIGIGIIHPENGSLACGEQGNGRLANPEVILQHLHAHLHFGQNQQNKSEPLSHIEQMSFLESEPNYIEQVIHHTSEQEQFENLDKTKKILSEQRPMKILVTAGGTQEPIDAVRVISNLSSGRTGIQLAEKLKSAGFQVTLIRSKNSQPSTDIVNEKIFTDYQSLQQILQSELANQSYDAIIHSAAVSDYSVQQIGENADQIIQKKLSSDPEQLTLVLKKNPKLIDYLKDYSLNKNVICFGFKLTVRANEDERKKAVKKLFNHSDVDYVVHNDLSEINVESGTHLFHVYNKYMTSSMMQNKSDLCYFISQILIKRLRSDSSESTINTLKLNLNEFNSEKIEVNP